MTIIAFKTNLTWVLSGIIIFIFIYSSIDKLLHTDSFSASLAQSLFIPQQWKTAVLWGTILMELVVPLLFIFRNSREVGFLLSFGIFMLFSGYVFLMMNYSPFLPCSCGGFMERLSWPQHLFLNIVLTIVALLGFLNEEKV